MPISPIVGSAARTGAIAVYGHTAHNVNVNNMFAEKVRYGFACLRHVLHKMRPADGKIGIVLHGLAYFSIGTANGDIFQRAAEAARSVPFKMRQHNHAVISGQAFADVHFLKMLAARQRLQ